MKVRALLSVLLVSALCACNETPVAADNKVPATATTFSCGKEGDPLKLTGLCQDSAAALMRKDASIYSDTVEGCVWQVMETALPGDEVLLYRGLKCAAGTTMLEFAGGADHAELLLAHSAYSGKLNEPSPLVSLYIVEGDPMDSVTARAKAAIENPKDFATCQARAAKTEGWASDAIVVDVNPEVAAKEPDDEPRSACGPLGYDGDATMYWRTGQGYAWFFNMGQDAFEIDPGSFTVVKKGESGRWSAI